MIKKMNCTISTNGSLVGIGGLPIADKIANTTLTKTIKTKCQFFMCVKFRLFNTINT